MRAQGWPRPAPTPSNSSSGAPGLSGALSEGPQAGPQKEAQGLHRIPIKDQRPPVFPVRAGGLLTGSKHQISAP